MEDRIGHEKWQLGIFTQFAGNRSGRAPFPAQQYRAREGSGAAERQQYRGGRP
jgi:hypothetical protein